MYLNLLQKIDRHIEKVRARNPGAFVCRSGCADCCVAGISVWRVEYENMRKHIKMSRAKFRPSKKKGRCPFLSGEDTCSVYPARPVVCRLWGAPLLFGPVDDPMPNADEISKRISSDKGVLTVCNKNFKRGAALKKLKAADIINLDLVLRTLAAINHVYCKEHNFDPAERLKIAR